nr:unnamed protein product [Spirometra erinaceieuropaei]
MAEKPDDLYLPNAVIGRIIREALPEKTVVSREARSAISKAASSFILCVTSMASAHCEAGKRKTLAASDILGALRDMQFSSYESPLLEFLENYRTAMNAKKALKKNQTQNETSSVNAQQASEVISLDNVDEAETTGDLLNVLSAWAVAFVSFGLRIDDTDRTLHFKLGAVICDAPAMAFIKLDHGKFGSYGKDHRRYEAPHGPVIQRIATIEELDQFKNAIADPKFRQQTISYLTAN